ncbi:MAG: hypothetical protein AAGD32_14850 [Planctomycetota bacterium]
MPSHTLTALLLRKWNDSTSDEIYEAVLNAAKFQNVDVQELKNDNGKIPDNFEERVSRCDFVIAVDIHTSPAVYHEIGYASCLGKTLLLITDEKPADAPDNIYTQLDNKLILQTGWRTLQLSNDLEERFKKIRERSPDRKVLLSDLVAAVKTLAKLDYESGLYTKAQCFIAQRFLKQAQQWTETGPLSVEGNQEVLMVGTEILKHVHETGFATLWFGGLDSWYNDLNPDTDDDYLRTAKDAAQRGVDIRRVYILDKQTDADDERFRELVRKDVLHGIKATYAVPDEAWFRKHGHLKDFAIWDDTLLAEVQYTQTGQTKDKPRIVRCLYSPLKKDGERLLSVRDGTEVKSYVEIVEKLNPKPAPAIPVEDFFLAEYRSTIEAHAEEHCAETHGCRHYHGSWPLLRLLRGVSTPTWHSDFYFDHIRQWSDQFLETGGGSIKVLISGMADFGMLYHLVQSIGVDKIKQSAIEFHLLDRCKTPIEACRTLREKLSKEPLETLRVDLKLMDKQVDILDSAGLKKAHVDPGSYHLICSDAFLTRTTDFMGKSFSPEHIFAVWSDLLTPGGAIITTARIKDAVGTDITSDLRRSFEQRMLDKLDEHRAQPDSPLSHVDPDHAREQISGYAQFIESRPFPDRDALSDELDRFPEFVPSTFFSTEDIRDATDDRKKRFIVRQIANDHEMVEQPYYARISLRKKA